MEDDPFSYPEPQEASAGDDGIPSESSSQDPFLLLSRNDVIHGLPPSGLPADGNRPPARTLKSGVGRVRLRSHRWFLTYPQCPHAASESLLAHLKNLGSARTLVCREKHKDGSEHLHAYAEWNDRFETPQPSVFDFLYAGQRYHGNYQTARSAANVAAYIVKDGDYTNDGFDRAFMAAVKKRGRAGIRSELGERLLKREVTLVEAVRECPNLLFSDLDRVARNLERVWETESPPPRVTELDLWGTPFKFNPDSPIRGDTGNYQLFIRGPPNTGKTSLFLGPHSVVPSGSVYVVNDPNNWSGFSPTRHGVVLFDDFDGNVLSKLSASVLFALMDGFGVQLNVKGSSVRLAHRVLVVFLSNFSPSIISDKPEVRESFCSRIKYFQVASESRSLITIDPPFF